MKIAHGSLVVAIDGRKMVVFRNEGDEKFIVLDTLEHSEVANAAAHEQGDHKPGRTAARFGGSRSSYQDTDWHERGEEQFAIAGAHRLDSIAKTEGGDIIVIAPSRTMGILRKHRGKAVSERMIAEITKDLVDHDWKDIAKVISAV